MQGGKAVETRRDGAVLAPCTPSVQFPSPLFSPSDILSGCPLSCCLPNSCSPRTCNKRREGRSDCIYLPAWIEMSASALSRDWTRTQAGRQAGRQKTEHAHTSSFGSPSCLLCLPLFLCASFGSHDGTSHIDPSLLLRAPVCVLLHSVLAAHSSQDGGRRGSRFFLCFLLLSRHLPRDLPSELHVRLRCVALLLLPGQLCNVVLDLPEGDLVVFSLFLGAPNPPPAVEVVQKQGLRLLKLLEGRCGLVCLSEGYSQSKRGSSEGVVRKVESLPHLQRLLVLLRSFLHLLLKGQKVCQTDMDERGVHHLFLRDFPLGLEFPQSVVVGLPGTLESLPCKLQVVRRLVLLVLHLHIPPLRLFFRRSLTRECGCDFIRSLLGEFFSGHFPFLLFLLCLLLLLLGGVRLRVLLSDHDVVPLKEIRRIFFALQESVCVFQIEDCAVRMELFSVQFLHLEFEGPGEVSGCLSKVVRSAEFLSFSLQGLSSLSLRNIVPLLLLLLFPILVCLVLFLLTVHLLFIFFTLSFLRLVCSSCDGGWRIVRGALRRVFQLIRGCVCGRVLHGCCCLVAGWGLGFGVWGSCSGKCFGDLGCVSGAHNFCFVFGRVSRRFCLSLCQGR
mmetsp:Transcript_37301/g.73387  ORF Transcript_37301/g.73387 Transcript_37301/m.73387 type:complete len:613 (-) Transcript_37301:127-1965(-)